MPCSNTIGVFRSSGPIDTVHILSASPTVGPISTYQPLYGVFKTVTETKRKRRENKTFRIGQQCLLLLWFGIRRNQIEVSLRMYTYMIIVSFPLHEALIQMMHSMSNLTNTRIRWTQQKKHTWDLQIGELILIIGVVLVSLSFFLSFKWSRKTYTLNDHAQYRLSDALM